MWYISAKMTDLRGSNTETSLHPNRVWHQWGTAYWTSIIYFPQTQNGLHLYYKFPRPRSLPPVWLETTSSPSPVANVVPDFDRCRPCPSPSRIPRPGGVRPPDWFPSMKRAGRRWIVRRPQARGLGWSSQLHFDRIWYKTCAAHGRAICLERIGLFHWL